MADLGVQAHKEFQTTFCVRCRNPHCIHAKWASDQFGARIATQLDRFFSPVQADPSDPRFQGLEDFVSTLREEKIRVEADRRGDWTVPEVPVTDGVSNKAELDQTSTVDDAARQLSRVRGGDDLELPDPVAAEIDGINEDMEALPDEPPPPEPKPVPTAPPQNQPSVQMGNTDVPDSGLMVDGSPVPPPKEAEKPDPWAAPKKSGTKVVQPGTRIKMGEDQ